MTKIIIDDLSDPSSYVCPRVKFWFRRHGLSWEDFKKNGIEVSELRKLNDQGERIDALEKTALRRMAKEQS